MSRRAYRRARGFLLWSVVWFLFGRFARVLRLGYVLARGW